jgi:gp178|nr:MAG TPA: Protein of unknown function (DUF1642) [Caudoviricetes sp.]
MKKQELIEKYEYLNHNYFRRVDTSEVLRDLKQLDEPEKVIIPQFVADWYEENEDDFEGNLFRCIYEIYKKRNDNELTDNELTKFEEWIIDGTTKPFKTLVNMHQFGYEVEKEKRYLVKMKGLNEDNSYLNYDLIDNAWYITDAENGTAVGTHHTRKELEETGFGWVFDCPGIEVEEVTE